MYATMSIMFDRLVDKNLHYISPQGYEITVKDSDYENTFRFDFMDTIGTINTVNPRIVHFEVRNLDEDSFGNMDELRQHLGHIVSLNECNIHTGEDDVTLKPVRIISFSIFDEGEGYKECPVSTPFVMCAHQCDGKNWNTEYRFTKRLLDTHTFSK